MRLNVEQRRIIEVEPGGHMLVKGVAGSGKTTVAVHRLTFLHQHFCPELDDNILLVTFNKTLLKYIQHQYDVLEASDDSIYEGFFSSEADVVIESIDKLMFTYFRKYQNRYRLKNEIGSRRQRRKLFQRAILAVQKKYPDIKVLSLKNQAFLYDEVEWIKACDIPDLETYQTIDRIGRSDGGKDSPQKLTKESRTRESIFILMEQYEKILAKDNLIDLKTMNKRALLEVCEVDHRKFTHIIIDESQDLSKVQLKFLQQLHREKSYSSIMFVADNTQSIYSQSWLGKGRPYTTIGYDMSGRARTLSKNYRTTTEISKAAYALIENDEQIKSNVDFVKPALIDRHGHAPIYRFFVNIKDQTEFLILEINKLQNDYCLKEICIVAREGRLLENAAKELNLAGIETQILNQDNPDFAAKKVNLVTMHSIKGLEFKVIFLINVDDNVIPSPYNSSDDESLTEERKLMYVGMTRANELLYMSSVRRPSCFIKEIDNRFLRFRKDASLRPFQSMTIQNYFFKEEIIDLNSREEVTRQWLIRELVEVYNYPLELISIEYPVQQFSRRGYVDIAITIDVEGEQVPYLFAEVKSFAQGISDALPQLKSYMAATPQVRYGVVTDGIDLIIINHQGQEVIDLPPCHRQFLPMTKRSRKYINFRNRREYEYSQELADAANFEIVDLETNLIVEQRENIAVPLVGDVAAGIPTEALQHYEESLIIPKEWVVNQQDTFALRVTGDSMIDAGINKGDYVIVNRQGAATNGDIVIALIGDEATMKKYMMMGNSVLLISENASYEPIQMNEEDVKINGKVIGVLKG